MTRNRFVRSPVAFVCVVVSVCCLLVVIITVLKLPEVSVTDSKMASFRARRLKKGSEDEKISQFGEMIIEMLPEDLAFTVFVPSERAFERDLGWNGNDSLTGDKFNNTHAILTRILGFSAVPRTISSVSVPSGEEICYDSLSGFSLYILKDSDGMLIVNRVRSERVDLRKGKIVVHVMDGVIMDAEFEQSVQPDYNEV
ncbi:FAS1 domain protein [Actinidia chinensis var. chinensis]|uniref:FAS1 domain protein n=1 Tax=Actinidia chinensis var. chinensis TaxID=1590841 RepID=A0A2R6RWT1_ACTCC|nr:FAS1 domain protein [Actinidia chinensis var. chinensis]